MIWDELAWLFNKAVKAHNQFVGNTGLVVCFIYEIYFANPNEWDTDSTLI